MCQRKVNRIKTCQIRPFLSIACCLSVVSRTIYPNIWLFMMERKAATTLDSVGGGGVKFGKYQDGKDLSDYFRDK